MPRTHSESERRRIQSWQPERRHQLRENLMDGIAAINLADELQGIWAEYEVSLAMASSAYERQAELAVRDRELLAAVKRYLEP